MKIRNALSGHFDLRVYDANTGALTKSRSFRNLITNQGLIGYCSLNPNFGTTYFCVGNGTNAPSVDDTILGNFIAKTNGSVFTWQGSQPVAPDYVSSTKGTARFAAGTFDGTTITEVGVTNSQNTNPVFSRALILDDAGNPTSLTILANEYLDITYTLYYHPDLTDSHFSFAMDGVTYNCTARAAFVNRTAFANAGYGVPLRRGPIIINYVYNTQELGAITAEPVYSGGGRIAIPAPSSQNDVAYSAETPYSHAAQQTIALAQGNFEGGIGAMVVGYSSYYSYGLTTSTQIAFSPKLPKDANTEMTFVLQKTVSRWQEG